MDWKSLRQSAVSPVGSVPLPDSPMPSEASRTSQKPWLMDWKGLSTNVERKAPTKASRGSLDVSAFISNVEQVESGGRATAKNPNSTATGPFQFISSTWMDMVNQLGLDYTLADRTDPEKARVVMEEFTRNNLEKAKKDLGRDPSQTELYMYHFLGDASKFLDADRKTLSSDVVSSRVINSNKSVFYNNRGRERTVGEVLDFFGKKFKEDRNSISPQGYGYTVADREGLESLPTISSKEFINSPLATAEGRYEWNKRMREEYNASKKGMTRKQLDRYYSNHHSYARDKHPNEYVLHRFFEEEGINGIPERMQSYLDTHDNQISFTEMGGNMNGFVFLDNGDRAFINRTGNLGTVVHEIEHLRQQTDVREHGENAPHRQVNNYKYSKTPVAELYRLASKNSESEGFSEVFSAANSFDNPGEFLANFQDYLVNMPEGMSWSETKFYKELTEKVGEKKAIEMILETVSMLNRSEHIINRGRR